MSEDLPRPGPARPGMSELLLYYWQLLLPIIGRMSSLATTKANPAGLLVGIEETPISS